MNNILIVEDEQDLRELLEYELIKAQFKVTLFPDTKNIEVFLQNHEVDLLLIDRNLPQVEGSKFIEMQRKNGLDIPVIFLSAKVKKHDIEKGFERGADDYICKPFNLRELILRIRAVLNRTKKQEQTLLKHRDITIDVATKTLYINDTIKNITKLEYTIMVLFLENKNVVLDRYALMEAWGDVKMCSDKTINVALKRLRHKIDPDKNKGYIKTVRGFGYILC